MKAGLKRLCFVLTFCMLGSCAPFAFAGSTEPEVTQETAETEQAFTKTEEGLSEEVGAEDEAEWTVMLYLCGTDLESEGGMASKNLEMISKTVPDSRVNMVIQTGGAHKWQSEKAIGIDIASDRLQRWSYDDKGFTLVDEQENASMARYDTLSDFIGWCSENYPARKNMLILWDHGGGASGIIQDEAHDYALMGLDSVEQALKDGGAHFDVVLMDACMMANIETAQMLQPYADYLLASEEVVPGLGSNYEEWLQDLYDEPECDAVRVGRNVCNATQILYAEQRDASSMNGLTFSVIDLSRIDEAAEAFEAYMKEVVGLLDDPYAFGTYVDAVRKTDRYWDRCLWDLYDLARRAMSGGISKETALRLEKAVDDAVIASIRGSYHPYSHGLSVYLAYNGDLKMLNSLARCDRNPWQLAFLDAVSLKWDAPAWVTDIVGRIPQLEPELYEVKYDTEISEDLSQLLIHIHSGVSTGGFLRYELQRYEEELQSWYTYGVSEDVTPLSLDDGEYVFSANFTGMWPAIDGYPLSMESKDLENNVALMQAPVRVPDFTDEVMQLRIIAEFPKDPYEGFLEETSEETEADTEEGEEESAVKYSIVGFWDGYDSSTGLPDRNTWSMAELEGKDMEIGYPIYSDYLKSIGDMRYYDAITVSTALEVENAALPEGVYRMRYKLSDMLDKTYTSDFYTFSWDGEKVVFDSPDEEDAEEDTAQAA